MLRTLLFAAGLLLFTGTSLCAEGRVYRCNGVVQFAPCNPARSAKLAVPANLNQKENYRAAKIINPTFSPVANGEGVWRGFVEGTGKVHLLLAISHKGVTQYRRYMGNIMLTAKDRMIPFTFKSLRPKEDHWGWQILAVPG